MGAGLVRDDAMLLAMYFADTYARDVGLRRRNRKEVKKCDKEHNTWGVRQMWTRAAAGARPGYLAQQPYHSTPADAPG